MSSRSKTTLSHDCNKLEKNGLDIKLGQNTLQHQAGETILETLERHNIEAEYNCREGFCGVCRTKLLQGSINYTLDPLAFIEDDEVLTCCTVPTSNLEIKIVY